MLAFLYFSQAAEHQAAMIALIGNQLFGSALVLARAVFEIMYRTNWIAQQASDGNVKQILAGEDFSFPKLADMAAQIDDGFGAGRLVTLKNAHWKDLNSFAHTGELQLMRRFKQGSIEPNYPTEELIRVIELATTSMLSCAVVVAGHCEPDVRHKFMRIVSAYGSARDSREPNSVESGPQQSG